MVLWFRITPLKNDLSVTNILITIIVVVMLAKDELGCLYVGQQNR
jgi:hypothetical protein